jgi:hypothetical protein
MCTSVKENREEKKMLAADRLKIAHIQKRPRAIACEVSIHEKKKNLILKI